MIAFMTVDGKDGDARFRLLLVLFGELLPKVKMWSRRI
jgi:hypothetical protein